MPLRQDEITEVEALARKIVKEEMAKAKKPKKPAVKKKTAYRTFAEETK